MAPAKAVEGLLLLVEGAGAKADAVATKVANKVVVFNMMNE
jgi:hypothetical protein